MGAEKISVPPSGRGCWKRMRDRLDLVLVVVVIFCSFYFWFGSSAFAFDGNDNTIAALVCNKYFHLFFVILKIPEKKY